MAFIKAEEHYLSNSPIAGHGLFASRDYGKDEAVIEIIAAQVPQPLNYINHSCAPNAVIHKLIIFARRPINKGEEITIDYAQMQFTVRPEEFNCNCEAPNCRRRISVWTIR